jgi:hypothetical protein
VYVISESYWITLSILLTYLKISGFNWTTSSASKQSRVCGAKYGDAESNGLKLSCSAQVNNTAVCDHTAKENAIKIVLMVGIECKYLNGWLKHFKE